MLDYDAKEKIRCVPGEVGGNSVLQVKTVNSLDELECHADAWNAMAMEAPNQMPTLSHAWVASFFENQLRPDEKWHTILAFDNDMLVGVLPVIVTPNHMLGFSRPRLSTPQNKHSFSVDFIAARGREGEIVPALLAHLWREEPRPFDFLLSRLPETSRTLEILSGGFERSTIVKELDGYGSYLKIDRPFEVYRKTLSRNFSRNLTKAKNKLARMPGVKTVFLSGRDATEEQLELFMRVEASGWKAQAGTAILQSPNLKSYYTALCRRLGQLGWLEWHFLLSEERVLAAQLGVKMGRTLVILKIAYDEEFSSCSPGTILMERTLERAFNLGETDEVNLITDMAWHENWEMLQRKYFNLWIYPRRPIPILMGAMGRRAKIEIRRLPGFMPAYRRFSGLLKGGRK
jgi:CelD/BcsL family acetyltransferase involved in cellulose biosynthesis